MLWVRPGVLEAKARRFCCVSVLMQVDLPALERPTKAISGTSSGRQELQLGAVVRKRAVCSQPSASGALAARWVARGGAVVRRAFGLRGNRSGRIVESRGFAPPNRDPHMKPLAPADGCLAGSPAWRHGRRTPPSAAAQPRRGACCRQARSGPGAALHTRGQFLRAPATAPTATPARRPTPSWRSSTPNTWSSSCRSSRPASAQAPSCRVRRAAVRRRHEERRLLGRLARRPSRASPRTRSWCLGERIYRGGIADRQVPPAPAATAPTAPASRRSTRACPASTPTTPQRSCRLPRRRPQNSPQMTQIAAKLNDREIRAVADYIAGLR